MYKIIFQAVAEKVFRKLDKNIQEMIGGKIEKLKSNPKLGIPLIGNLKGFWKLRVGKYRVIYTIRDNELVVLIVKVGKRDNIYD